VARKEISKIIVPLDGTTNSFKGLEFALNLAKNSKASIGCVCVIPQHISFGKEIQLQMRKKASKTIAKAKAQAQRKGIGIDTTILYKDTT